MAVGATVGVAVGATVGVAVGATVGVAVGATVGVAVGATVGVAVGATVGVAVGATVGVAVGQRWGLPLAWRWAFASGSPWDSGVGSGFCVGVAVGSGVGATSGTTTSVVAAGSPLFGMYTTATVCLPGSAPAGTLARMVNEPVRLMLSFARTLFVSHRMAALLIGAKLAPLTRNVVPGAICPSTSDDGFNVESDGRRGCVVATWRSGLRYHQRQHECGNEKHDGQRGEPVAGSVAAAGRRGGAGLRDPFFTIPEHASHLHSAARLTQRVPWLCGPASRRVCYFVEADPRPGSTRAQALRRLALAAQP